ncbi:transcription factor APG-like isoform X2 [Mercurialis annua]|uniref:transcription factor APG-like isoform X2 n=1 Tax=Mercurialis annua TaxID=3986 RepID=UPI0024ACC4DB|nr:transcription factor APG-like isoform X2 [Mercurialis annua]
MNNPETCTCMLSHFCSFHQNFLNTTNSELEKLEIFGGFTDFQNMHGMQYQNDFLHDLHNEESTSKNQTNDTQSQNNEIEALSVEARRTKRDKRPRSGAKRNLYERRRRDRIREKIKTLKELVPHRHNKPV